MFDLQAVQEAIAPFLLFALAVAAYFLPTIAARHRHNANTTAIFPLNLFLGWTFIGWVVALVWANIVQPKQGSQS